MFHEENDTDKPFVVIILFTDKKYDPGDCPLICAPPNRFIRLYLPDCIKKLGDKAGVLTVLKPLVLPRKADLPEAVSSWKSEIRSLERPEHEIRELEDLLIYSILQRFSKLSREEVEKMVELTPIEQTVVGQELIQIGMEQGERKGRKEGKKEGRKEGRKEGMQKGELIGRIQMAQSILNAPLTPHKNLSLMSLKKLRELLKETQTELAKLRI
jgi:hypothetical protein